MNKKSLLILTIIMACVLTAIFVVAIFFPFSMFFLIFVIIPITAFLTIRFKYYIFSALSVVMITIIGIIDLSNGIIYILPFYISTQIFLVLAIRFKNYVKGILFVSAGFFVGIVVTVSIACGVANEKPMEIISNYIENSNNSFIYQSACYTVAENEMFEEKDLSSTAWKKKFNEKLLEVSKRPKQQILTEFAGYVKNDLYANFLKYCGIIISFAGILSYWLMLLLCSRCGLGKFVDLKEKVLLSEKSDKRDVKILKKQKNKQIEQYDDNNLPTSKNVEENCESHILNKKSLKIKFDTFFNYKQCKIQTLNTWRIPKGYFLGVFVPLLVLYIMGLSNDFFMLIFNSAYPMLIVVPYSISGVFLLSYFFVRETKKHYIGMFVCIAIFTFLFYPFFVILGFCDALLDIRKFIKLLDETEEI